MHVRANKQVDVYTGQGLGETKWSGWALNVVKKKAKISVIAKSYPYSSFFKSFICDSVI